MLQFLLFLLFSLKSGASEFDESRRFEYLAYPQIVATLKALNAMYPHVVDIYSSQEEYGIASPGDCADVDGNTVPCEQWVIRITNENTYAEGRPEVFFSGCLHGNERVGPTTTMEFAKLLLENYAEGTNPWLKRLVDTRVIVIMPSPNALGYFTNSRTENSIDPNRDFPYNTRATQCMQTTAGQALNEVWRRHLFQLAITFHGGMKAISYEWGSDNHNVPFDISPDETSQLDIAKGLQWYSDAGYYTDQWVGRLSPVVYPVGGGMEDWAYAASWDVANSEPCTPTTYDGYPKERTMYEPYHLRAFNMLVETADLKTPLEGSLGTVKDLLKAPSTTGTSTTGHVARNLRLCVLMADAVQPYVVWTGTSADIVDVSRGSPLHWDVGGAFHVDASTVLFKQLSDEECTSVGTSGVSETMMAEMMASLDEEEAASRSGPTFWKDGSFSPVGVTVATASPYTARFTRAVDLPAGHYVAVAVAKVDSSWSVVPSGSTPTGVNPQAHIVNARTVDGYEARNLDEGSTSVIQGRLWWPAPARCIVVAPPPLTGTSTSSSTTTAGTSTATSEGAASTTGATVEGTASGVRDAVSAGGGSNHTFAVAMLSVSFVAMLGVGVWALWKRRGASQGRRAVAVAAGSSDMSGGVSTSDLIEKYCLRTVPAKYSDDDV